MNTGVPAPFLPFAPTRMDPEVNAKRSKSDGEGQMLGVPTYMQNLKKSNPKKWSRVAAGWGWGSREMLAKGYGFLLQAG